MLNYDRLNDLIKKSGIKKAAICERLGRNYYYLRDAQKTNANIPTKSRRYELLWFKNVFAIQMRTPQR